MADTIIIEQPVATVLEVGTVGPQGPTGPQGPAGSVSGSIAWSNVTGKPATFEPSLHAVEHEPGESDTIYASAALVTTNVAALNGVYFNDGQTTAGGRDVFYKTGTRKNTKLQYNAATVRWELIRNLTVEAESAEDAYLLPWGQLWQDLRSPVQVASITVTRLPLETMVQRLAETGSTSVATTSEDGLLSASDKTKLNSIASGAEVNVNADWTASSGDAQILNKPTSLTPTSHAASHYTGASDELAAHQINGQTIFDRSSVFYSADQTLSAQRARVLTINNTNSNGITVTFRTEAQGTKVGDTYVLIAGNTFSGPVTIRGLVNLSPPFYQTLATLTASGQQFRFRSQGGSTGDWSLVPVDSHSHAIADVTELQTALDGKQASGSYVTTSDSRLTDSREWSASTIDQTEAEAGTSTTRRAFTALRVFQAIAAWWAGSAAKTKLDGIATGATANAADAQLRDRSTHTGTQAHTTITGLGTLATQSGTFSGTSSGTNTGDQTITLTGDVTGSGTGSFSATIANNAVTNAKLAQVSTATIKGRATASTGNVEDLTASQARGVLALATTDNVTFGSLQGTPVGSTTANSGAFTTLSANNGTLTTASAPVLDLSQTWNNAAATFTGLRFNATNTASSTTSLLADFQVGGVSRASIRQDGMITAVQLQASSLIFSGGDVQAATLGAFYWASNDLFILRDAADTLAQRRTTNPQTFRLYNTYTDASNHERGFMRWSSNVLQIGTEKAGTGSARALELQVDGSTFLGATTGGTVRFGSQTTQSTTLIGWFGNCYMRPVNASAGVLTLLNNALDGFDRLQFGGTTSSFPALKRSSTALQVRLADDTADAPLSCSAITVGAGTAAGQSIVPNLSTPLGIYWSAAGDIRMSQSNIDYLRFLAGQIVVAGNGRFSWGSGTAVTGADLHLWRDAAGVLAQYNGVNGQAYRLYNTVSGTNNVNFERANLRWASNEFIIDAEAGGTGTSLRGIKIGSATSSLLGFYGATPVTQRAAIADATDAATTQARLNDLLAAMRSLGLIAT